MEKQHSGIDFATVLASSVHDMKNSLCMLLQSLETLQREETDLQPASREELARIHYETNRLNSNLLQLLALYRLEKDQLPLQIDQHCVADLFEDIVLANELFTEQKSIAITVKVDPNLLAYYDADLLGNLLNDIFVNAVRYCHSQVMLVASTSEQGLLLEIHDDGPGYPNVMLHEADTLMSQLKLSTRRTGLGLFFASLIAKAHRNQGKTGEIRLKNGGFLGGAVFSVLLP